MSHYHGSIQFDIIDEGSIRVDVLTVHHPDMAEIDLAGRCFTIPGHPVVRVFFNSESDLRAWAVELCRMAMAKSARVSPEERELVLNGVQPS